MLIVRVKRKRGDSRYVKAGIRRSSGGCIRLRQSEIQEYTRKGEMYVLEDRGTVEGCLLISIDGTNLSINIISISPYCITSSVCNLIIDYAKSLSRQAEELVVMVSRHSYNMAILLRNRGLVVVSVASEWVTLHGLFPLRETNTHVTTLATNRFRHQPFQRSLWSPRGWHLSDPFPPQRIAQQEPPGPLRLGQDSLHLFQTPGQIPRYPSFQRE